MEQRVRRATREESGRRRRSLDRPDSADETLATAELGLGGGDDQNLGDGVCSLFRTTRRS
jgi:hypothetical protein